MWDFSFGRSVAIVLRTLPFVLLRMAVYFGIGFLYLVTIGLGAVLGYGFGHLGTNPDAPVGGAFWGGLLGFGITSAALYFAREYILYLVKAAHIACMVELLDGRSIPAGQGQLGFGAKFVETHFTEASVLFGVDQIIKAVLRSLFGIINFFSAFLPIPALQQLLRVAEAIVRMSLTYVDEVILAYLIRTRTKNPWNTAKDGLILYAQNYSHFLKNAIWLSIFLWLCTVAIFAVIVGPFAGLAALIPSGASLWGVGLAIIFALAFKAAILEPIAVAALMQVFFKTIEGQTPNAEWEQRLDGASRRFRELVGKAAQWVPGTAATSAASPTAGTA
jgi:hypothetical protein